MRSKLETMQVKPARNRTVRYPSGHGANSRKPIPESGASVPMDRYFTRRLRCGDLVRIDEPKPEREPQPKPKSSKPKSSKPKAASKPKSSKPKSSKPKETTKSSASSKAEV